MKCHVETVQYLYEINPQAIVRLCKTTDGLRILSWQRGSIEYSNGLLREIFRKGQNLEK